MANNWNPNEPIGPNNQWKYGESNYNGDYGYAKGHPNTTRAGSMGSYKLPTIELPQMQSLLTGPSFATMQNYGASSNSNSPNNSSSFDIGLELDKAIAQESWLDSMKGVRGGGTNNKPSAFSMGSIFGATDDTTGKFNMGWGLPALNTLGNIYGLSLTEENMRKQNAMADKNYQLAMEQWNTQKAAASQSADDMINRRVAEGSYSLEDAQKARARLGITDTKVG